MKPHDIIKYDCDMAEMVGMTYLKDLSDEDLMQRPADGCNHINWQVGHLIASEHDMMEKVFPGRSPKLPAGFAEKYSRETTGESSAAKFADKATLMEVFGKQRAATKEILSCLSADDLSKAAPAEMQAYAPTIGAMFALQGSHWMMHCGQWVIVRRQKGLPVAI